MNLSKITPAQIQVAVGTQEIEERVLRESIMKTRMIGLVATLSYLLVIIGIIVGVVFMLKSKKNKEKRILIGTIIIVASIILGWILSFVEMAIRFNI